MLSQSSLRRALVSAVVALALAVVAAPTAGAWDGWSDVDPSADQVRGIVFPVDGENSYVDSWLDPRGGGRRHLGVDLMAEKLVPVLAARDGCITFLRHGGRGGGNMAELTDGDGWAYRYIHLNNDSPGTDDGANPMEWAFPGGLAEGDCVEAGAVISYVGDSGNAEGTAPHLHFEMRRPDGEWINPYPSVEAARRAGGDSRDGVQEARSCGPIDVPEADPDPASGAGYWLLDSEGAVHALGDAESYGDLTDADDGPAARPVALQSTVSGEGYWILDADGVVHPFGDAVHRGDMSGVPLNGPVLALAPRQDGSGYWLVASDGGIFSFDVPFLGSMGGIPLNAPVIAMVAHPIGLGYLLIASDGGVFTFGDAVFRGSTGSLTLAAPVISGAHHPGGDGYWLYAEDGGVFSYGVDFHGSVPGLALCEPAETVAMRVTGTGGGYWLAATDGRVFAFGDAAEHGDVTGLDAGVEVIDLAVARQRED